MVDLAGLCNFLQDLKDESFVIVPLLGWYKGEQHSRYHLAPLAATSDSGLQVRTWITRLVQVQEEAGHIRGPAFQDNAGNILGSHQIEVPIVERLQMRSRTHRRESFLLMYTVTSSSGSVDPSGEERH